MPELVPLQQGDVPDTIGSELVRAVSYKPETPVKAGIERFVKWYLDDYDR